jgi:hypothetical protein
MPVYEIECQQCGKVQRVEGPPPKGVTDIQAVAFKLNWRTSVVGGHVLILCSTECVIAKKRAKE